ncbi:MAG: MBL fold metallo-hydrolase [Gammaproteobacteria bacterium]|nr:MBL fold metallo-hydrolase [Gammaproteobacteria bacterium]
MNKASLPLLLLALTAAAHAQQLATTIKSTEVVPGIYMLEGADGFSSNMGLLVGDEHVLLVDDGMAPITANLTETVQKLAGRPIDFVVNTHVHSDHVGSNAALATNGALIVAHDNLRKRLVEKPDDAGGPAGLPVVTFADAVTFYVNGHEAHVFHVAAAHTDGDAVIHFRDVNVIDAGDLHFNYMFPFIDLDSGGSVAGFIAGQRRIIAAADDETKIIPGHGPLASKSDLQAAVDMLVDAQARVEALVLEGKTEEEVLAAEPLSRYHDTWNWGFITTEKMTQTLYRSLTSL